MAKSVKKIILEYLIIVLLAFCMAMVYEVLIFPNSFAPAGINGLATIVQHYFGFSIGYMSIIINIPLLAVVFFVVDKEFALKSLCFVLVFSLFTLITKNCSVAMGDLKYCGDNAGFLSVENLVYKNGAVSTILAPIASGAINGFIYGFTIRHNACTGGTDLIARLVKQKRPELNIMWLTFALNSVVALLSLFAYAENGVFNLEPVILCIIYCFTSSMAGDLVLKGYKTALKFEVVTSYPEEISREIITNLKHSATVVKAQGMYTHEDKSLLICVINKHQIVDFEKIITKYPGTFAYISSVNETVGNFVSPKKKKGE